MLGQHRRIRVCKRGTPYQDESCHQHCIEPHCLHSFPSSTPGFLGHTTRAERAINKWIVTKSHIRNRIQEIWIATVDTPPRFRAPAIKPTTRKISEEERMASSC